MPGPFKFAWVGGVIQEQQTLVINGNTHGGIIETATIVGDVSGGTAALFNMAGNSVLSDAELYAITGPGLDDGTFFIYDGSILAPEAGAVNLSAAAVGTVANATYVATKAMLVGSTAAAMSAGSNTITLVDDIGLLPGLYCISGTNIGQTASPEGGLMFVNSAFADYGGGGTMALYIFGPGGTQAVTAISTGTYPIRITGMPDADWYSITGIPAGALNGLTAGLRYNIAGNGLQAGTTFVAPASGATAITIDQPATASVINGIFTVTGPRAPNADFDPVAHAREDEEIVGLEIAQEEGGLATLTIEIRNPHVGLLALGRNLWCWLSWDANYGSTPDIVPLFNGRLVGVPKFSTGEIVTLEFLARPDDYNEQKAALSAAMAVLPYYDPIWITSAENPDTVLETYSSLWHVDRTSLVLTASDILQGEDGIVTIGEDAAFYDAFSLAYGAPPLVAVNVSGTVSWSQQGDGSLDVTDTLVSAFAAAGSPYKGVFGGRKFQYPRFGYTRVSGGGLIQVTAGEGLRQDWPKPGTTIGGGWTLSTDNEGEGKPLCYIIEADQPNGWLELMDYKVNYTLQQPMPSKEEIDETLINPVLLTTPYINVLVNFPLNSYKIRMVLDWRAERDRTETVEAVLTANVQRELSDSADSDREDIALTSSYVGQATDAGGQVPIGSLAQRSYFQSARGALSFEYLLLAARAKMRSRARSVDITFGVPWAVALGITLRHNVTYLDRRLPGGNATGKVKSYKLVVADGGMWGEFVIGCSIGNGDPSTAAEGVPSYVDAGYVDAGYQVIAGSQKMLLAGELAYQTLDDFVIDDDGLDLTNMTLERAINGCVVVNGLEHQLNTLAEFQNKIAPHGDPITAIAELSTAVTLDLKPVTGNSFHTTFFPSVSQLSLPKTIDLAATSG